MQFMFDIYARFLALFPFQFHGLISIGFAALFLYSFFKILEKSYLWIIVTILLLPISIPVFVTIWNGTVAIVQYLLGK